MKKAVLILAVLVVFSTLAFAAPNVGVGIWARSTFQLALSNSVDSKIYSGWSDKPGSDQWNPDYEPAVWFTSDSADLNLGWIIRYWGISTVNAYATLRVVPDLLTVRFGLYSGNGLDTYRRTDNWDLNNNNTGRMAGQGIWITLEPKDSNFSATVFYQAPTWSVWDKWQVMQLAQLAEFAAAYTVPNTVKITAGSNTVGSNGATDLVRTIFGRVEVLAVSGLTAFVDVSYDGLEGTTNTVANSNLNAFLSAWYQMDALQIGLIPTLSMATPKSGGAGTMGWSAQLGVVYNLGDFTPQLGVKVTQANTTASNMDINVTPQINFNKFNAHLAFSFDYHTTGGAYEWKIPVWVDSSFW